MAFRFDSGWDWDELRGYLLACLLACVLAVHHGLLIPINFSYTPHVLDTLAVTGCDAIRQSLDERRPPRAKRLNRDIVYVE
jgi:hypothetical protein